MYIYYYAIFKINRSKFTHAVYGTPYYGTNNGWPALYMVLLLKHILMLKVVESSIVLIVDLGTWSKRPSWWRLVRSIP